MQRKMKRGRAISALRIASVALFALCAQAFIPQTWMRSGAAWAAPMPQIPVEVPPQKPKQNQKELPNEGQIRANVNLVRLYVTVRDKHGALVPNLEKTDFKVFEDGREQKISFFSKDMTDPITLALMIDTSGSQEYLLDAEKATADRFLRDILRKNDLAMVLSFDTEVNLLCDFTDSQDLLQRAVEKAEIQEPGGLGPVPSQNQAGTVLYDAIYLVSRDKLPAEAGRKAMIILTDAQDEGSQQTLKNAIEAAQQANVVVHVLLIADRAGYFMSGQIYTGGSVAHQLAAQTGGRVISIRNDNDLDKAFTQISEELRSQYILAYYPADVNANGGYRKIKVEATPGLKVLTREGYYAPGSLAAD